MLCAFSIYCNWTRKLTRIRVFFCTLGRQNRTPLKKWKEDGTKTNKAGSSNSSPRSMSSPSFIEFGQPRFPRSDTLSQSGPLKNRKRSGYFGLQLVGSIDVRNLFFFKLKLLSFRGCMGTTVNEVNNYKINVSDKFILRRISLVCFTTELDEQIDSQSMYM